MAKAFDETSRSMVLRVQDVRRLLVVRIGTLRRVVHRSAKLAYARESGLGEFEWRVLLFVGAHARPTPRVVSDSLRRDKGQVSRAVARLTAAGLIEREGARAPLRLTEDGGKVHARMHRLQGERNAALLNGLGAQDRRKLDACLDKLFSAALQLLDEERALQGLGVDKLKGDDGRKRPSRLGDRWRASRETDPASPDWLVVPDLHVLMQLLQESAALSYKRTAGLAHFDRHTVSNMAVAGPLALADLAEALDRDMTQASRAVGRLAEQGIVTRRRRPGGSRLILSLSEKGWEVFEKIHAEARRRDRVLIGELTITECERLFRILDRMTRNALALIVREQGLELAACDDAGRARASAAGSGDAI